jgi:hypothetical protein
MDINNIEQQYNKFTDYITKYISEPRASKLMNMYDTFNEKLCTAPASSHSTRHNCFPGGYIDHVNRVVETAIVLYDVWSRLNAPLEDTSLEEVVFAAINHDLGKLGSSKEEYYIPNDQDWQVKKGQIYRINPSLNFMKVPDRSIYLLQEFGIEMSEAEYLSIKLHDGLYGKGNESYLMPGIPEFSLKTNLPILIHHADHLATLIESKNHAEVTSTKKKTNQVNDPVADANLKNIFDSMFN